MMIKIKKIVRTCGSSVLKISGNNMLTYFKGGLPVKKISCENLNKTLE